MKKKESGPLFPAPPSSYLGWEDVLRFVEDVESRCEHEQHRAPSGKVEEPTHAGVKDGGGGGGDDHELKTDKHLHQTHDVEVGLAREVSEVNEEHGARDEPTDVAQPRHLATVIADNEDVYCLALEIHLQKGDDASHLMCEQEEEEEKEEVSWGGGDNRNRNKFVVLYVGKKSRELYSTVYSQVIPQ